MEYTSLNSYLKQRFGCKIYKLSINAGLSCPNRDGLISTGGCIFCSEGGSGDFTSSSSFSITEQIEQAKALVSSKIKTGKYIAYFQAFTNTYGPIEYLRKIFTEAILHKDIVAISIGTRPDCLPDEVIELLNELNQIKPVWIELGLQTIHESTAQYINRGYCLDVFDDAVNKLNSINVDIIVHVILGLPFESHEDILETVEYICSKKIQGIKLQLLHVLKNTPLAEEYNKGRFEVLEMDEYIELVGKCLKIIPKHIVIHRLTGDGPKNLLIAPKWSTDKKRVLNRLNHHINSI